MADDIREVMFNPPVYKNRTTNPGVLAEANDVIVIMLKGVDANGAHRTQNLTILTISDDGTRVSYEYDATNQYVEPNRIWGVVPNHTWECPEPDNIGITADDVLTATVTAFTVNGVETVGSWPVTEEGAAALQAALNAALVGDGAATVIWVNAATDYLQVYIMNTTATVTVDGNAVDPLP